MWEVLTDSLGRDEVAEVGTEEDEGKWEGHPHQVLQRQVGLHLGIGPLVDCRDTRWAQSPVDLRSPLPPPLRSTSQVKHAGSIFISLGLSH